MISGIYAIVNIINEKYYVGSAIDFTDRWRLHRLNLNRNKHHNRHLQAAWNLYGSSNFIFVVIEYNDRLLEREQFWIEKLDTTNIEIEYNICKVARNRTGVKASEETILKLSNSHKGYKHTEEWKMAMSERLKGNTINKNRKQKLEDVKKRAKSNTGQKRSEEAKARMSAFQKSRGSVSEETKKKMSKAAKNRKNLVDKSESVWI